MSAERLLKAPRKLLYCLAVFVLAFPLFVPLRLPIAISKETKVFYEYMEDLRGTDAHVLIIAMIPPPFWGEFRHLLFAILQHLFLLEDVKIIIAPVFMAPTMALVHQVLDMVSNPLNKTYGKDYVVLSFIPAAIESTFAMLSSDFRGSYQTDEFGTPIDELPAMDGVNTIGDFDAVIWCEPARWQPAVALYMYPKWPNVAYFGVLIAEGYYFAAPYIGNVYKSAIWGIRMAAEYQQLYGGPYSGAEKQMDGLSLYHILGIALIVVANVVYFAGRTKQKPQGKR